MTTEELKQMILAQQAEDNKKLEAQAAAIKAEAKAKRDKMLEESSERCRKAVYAQNEEIVRRFAEIAAATLL